MFTCYSLVANCSLAILAMNILHLIVEMIVLLGYDILSKCIASITCRLVLLANSVYEKRDEKYITICWEKAIKLNVQVSVPTLIRMQWI